METRDSNTTHIAPKTKLDVLILEANNLSAYLAELQNLSSRINLVLLNKAGEKFLKNKTSIEHLVMDEGWLDKGWPKISDLKEFPDIVSFINLLKKIQDSLTKVGIIYVDALGSPGAKLEVTNKIRGELLNFLLYEMKSNTIESTSKISSTIFKKITTDLLIKFNGSPLRLSPNMSAVLTSLAFAFQEPNSPEKKRANENTIRETLNRFAEQTWTIEEEKRIMSKDSGVSQHHRDTPTEILNPSRVLTIAFSKLRDSSDKKEDEIKENIRNFCRVVEGCDLSLMSSTSFESLDRTTFKRPCLIKDDKDSYQFWGYKEGKWQLTDLGKIGITFEWKPDSMVNISNDNAFFDTLKQGHTIVENDYKSEAKEKLAKIIWFREQPLPDLSWINKIPNSESDSEVLRGINYFKELLGKERCEHKLKLQANIDLERANHFKKKISSMLPVSQAENRQFENREGDVYAEVKPVEIKSTESDTKQKTSQQNLDNKPDVTTPSLEEIEQDILKLFQSLEKRINQVDVIPEDQKTDEKSAQSAGLSNRMTDQTNELTEDEKQKTQRVDETEHATKHETKPETKHKKEEIQFTWKNHNTPKALNHLVALKVKYMELLATIRDPAERLEKIQKMNSLREKKFSSEEELKKEIEFFEFLDEMKSLGQKIDQAFICINGKLNIKKSILDADQFVYLCILILQHFRQKYALSLTKIYDILSKLREDLKDFPLGMESYSFTTLHGALFMLKKMQNDNDMNNDRNHFIDLKIEIIALEKKRHELVQEKKDLEQNLSSDPEFQKHFQEVIENLDSKIAAVKTQLEQEKYRDLNFENVDAVFRILEKNSAQLSIQPQVIPPKETEKEEEKEFKSILTNYYEGRKFRKHFMEVAYSEIVSNLNQQKLTSAFDAFYKLGELDIDLDELAEYKSKYNANLTPPGVEFTPQLNELILGENIKNDDPIRKGYNRFRDLVGDAEFQQKRQQRSTQENPLRATAKGMGWGTVAGLFGIGLLALAVNVIPVVGQAASLLLAATGAAWYTAAAGVVAVGMITGGLAEGPSQATEKQKKRAIVRRAFGIHSERRVENQKKSPTVQPGMSVSVSIENGSLDLNKIPTSPANTLSGTANVQAKLEASKSNTQGGSSTPVVQQDSKGQTETGSSTQEIPQGNVLHETSSTSGAPDLGSSVMQKPATSGSTNISLSNQSILSPKASHDSPRASDSKESDLTPVSSEDNLRTGPNAQRRNSS